MNILALDIGTSFVHAAVLDTDTAQPLASPVKSHYSWDHPTPEAAEISAERLWNAVTAAVRAAVRPMAEVHAVGLSCLTPALVLLDARDQPLLPIWTHLDRRSRPAARQVWAAVGEEFLQTTGNRPLPGGISAICFRQQVQADPYLTHKVRWYLHLNGWLGLRMTGERGFDPANASFTGLFNTLTDQKWSPRWCDYFDVEPGWLPSIIDGRATLGNLRPEVAAELGVPAGIPVKLGTADTSSAMLAANMVPGDLLHVVGTTQVLATFADHPRPDPRRLTRRFGIGPRFVYVTHNPVGGAALDWLHQLCFRDQSAEEFFQKTVPETHGRKTRVTLDPPFLGGDRLEIEAHRAAFRDLTLATDRLDLLAAVLEAMVRHHQAAWASLDVAGGFRRIFLSGGGAEIVHQLIPEYRGASVHMLEDASLRGVAKLYPLTGCASDG